MAKSTQQPDVLVLGDHPSAYFAAALLGAGGSLRVAHAVIPGEAAIERLVTINPEFFELDPLLSASKRKLELAPIYGLRFLADDPAVSSSHVGKPIAAYLAGFRQVHATIVALAVDAGVQLIKPSLLQLGNLDEHGVDVRLDRSTIHPKLLILAGQLPPEDRQVIGVPDTWDGQVLHRYTFLRLKGPRWVDPASRTLITMSLDLKGTLNWAWLLPGQQHVQVSVVQPVESLSEFPAETLLDHWMGVLGRHGALKLSGAAPDVGAAEFLDLPLAGALAQEGVANRTLLIGPAGGFYTACAEEIYPACWSAVYAADVARKAVKEAHVQDALQPYRQKWGSTLGDYLRGPQQNLRFLLPLVYRNSMMTARLTEAILLGKSVVR